MNKFKSIISNFLIIAILSMTFVFSMTSCDESSVVKNDQQSTQTTVDELKVDVSLSFDDNTYFVVLTSNKLIKNCFTKFTNSSDKIVQSTFEITDDDKSDNGSYKKTVFLSVRRTTDTVVKDLIVGYCDDSEKEIELFSKKEYTFLKIKTEEEVEKPETITFTPILINNVPALEVRDRNFLVEDNELSYQITENNVNVSNIFNMSSVEGTLTINNDFNTFPSIGKHTYYIVASVKDGCGTYNWEVEISPEHFVKNVECSKIEKTVFNEKTNSSYKNNVCFDNTQYLCGVINYELVPLENCKEFTNNATYYINEQKLTTNEIESCVYDSSTNKVSLYFKVSTLAEAGFVAKEETKFNISINRISHEQKGKNINFMTESANLEYPITNLSYYVSHRAGNKGGYLCNQEGAVVFNIVDETNTNLLKSFTLKWDDKTETIPLTSSNGNLIENYNLFGSDENNVSVEKKDNEYIVTIYKIQLSATYIGGTFYPIQLNYFNPQGNTTEETVYTDFNTLSFSLLVVDPNKCTEYEENCSIKEPLSLKLIFLRSIEPCSFVEYCGSYKDIYFSTSQDELDSAKEIYGNNYSSYKLIDYSIEKNILTLKLNYCDEINNGVNTYRIENISLTLHYESELVEDVDLSSIYFCSINYGDDIFNIDGCIFKKNETGEKCSISFMTIDNSEITPISMDMTCYRVKSSDYYDNSLHLTTTSVRNISISNFEQIEKNYYYFYTTTGFEEDIIYIFIDSITYKDKNDEIKTTSNLLKRQIYVDDTLMYVTLVPLCE